jgi:hypothetical protein
MRGERLLNPLEPRVPQDTAEPRVEFSQFGQFAAAEQDKWMVVDVRKAHDAIEPDIEARHTDRLHCFYRTGRQRARHRIEHAQSMKRDVIELRAAQRTAQIMLPAKLPGEVICLVSRSRRQAEAEKQVLELSYSAPRQHELFAACNGAVTDRQSIPAAGLLDMD